GQGKAKVAALLDDLSKKQENIAKEFFATLDEHKADVFRYMKDNKFKAKLLHIDMLVASKEIPITEEQQKESPPPEPGKEYYLKPKDFTPLFDNLKDEEIISMLKDIKIDAERGLEITSDFYTTKKGKERLKEMVLRTQGRFSINEGEQQVEYDVKLRPNKPPLVYLITKVNGKEQRMEIIDTAQAKKISDKFAETQRLARFEIFEPDTLIAIIKDSADDRFIFELANELGMINLLKGVDDATRGNIIRKLYAESQPALERIITHATPQDLEILFKDFTLEEKNNIAMRTLDNPKDVVKFVSATGGIALGDYINENTKLTDDKTNKKMYALQKANLTWEHKTYNAWEIKTADAAIELLKKKTPPNPEFRQNALKLVQQLIKNGTLNWPDLQTALVEPGNENYEILGALNKFDDVTFKVINPTILSNITPYIQAT
ncbi:MAG: hypothetical protein KKA19_05405, partial [Candidatus Margulisbacteria bacterium]|nr:hypothetical protein [Candidatus Margulisiibacteriota bacterium]